MYILPDFIGLTFYEQDLFFLTCRLDFLPLTFVHERTSGSYAVLGYRLRWFAS